MTKTCTKCGQRKSMDHFTRDAKRPDGRESQCRACHQLKARQWRAQLGRDHFTPEAESR